MLKVDMNNNEPKLELRFVAEARRALKDGVTVRRSPRTTDDDGGHAEGKGRVSFDPGYRRLEFLLQLR